MPQRAIIVLDQTGVGPATYRYLLRADVPSGREVKYANPSYVSPFIPAPPDTDPDLAALRSGTVVEQECAWTFNQPVKVSDIGSALVQKQREFQTAINQDPTYSHYGTYWDGTRWVPQGL